jgi:putative hydrolase of the HAD superfamily
VSRFLLLDVDNTLYPRTAGVVDRIDVLIDGYLVERCGVPRDAVGSFRMGLRTSHGTTLRGLMARRDIDPDDYLRFVHSFDVCELLAPAPELARMLERIPWSKIAVTNGPLGHARAVLGRLGVAHCMDDVFALERLGYVPKPFPEAYDAVLNALGADAAACVMVEDTAANLLAARAAGMRTVHVTGGTVPIPEADATIETILELEGALARLEARPVWRS